MHRENAVKPEGGGEGGATMKLPPEYFENKIEQGKIKQAVLSAIPPDVYYHNLIIVFAEMLARFTEQAFKEEMYTKSAATEAAKRRD